MLWYLGKNKMKALKELLSVISKSDEIFAIAIVMLICQIFFIFIGSELGIITLIFWSIWLITISVFRYLNRKNKINNN